MANNRAFEAFSADNPAAKLWRLLSEDRVNLERIAECLGAKPELDDDSFLQAALEIEPPKGSA